MQLKAWPSSMFGAPGQSSGDSNLGSICLWHLCFGGGLEVVKETPGPGLTCVTGGPASSMWECPGLLEKSLGMLAVEQLLPEHLKRPGGAAEWK